MALRTVARDTAYVVISSRSDGIAVSGASSVVASSASASRSCACLGRGPSATIWATKNLSTSCSIGLVRSGTYQWIMSGTPHTCQALRGAE